MCINLRVSPGANFRQPSGLHTGIDGRIFPVSALDNRRKNKSDELDLEEKFFPIQVKQKDKLGRPDVDAFEAMMMREEVQKGFLVSFDYTGEAESEISRFFKQTGKVIVPLTVQEILGEQIAHKLAEALPRGFRGHRGGLLCRGRRKGGILSGLG